MIGFRIFPSSQPFLGCSGDPATIGVLRGLFAEGYRQTAGDIHLLR